MTVNELRIGNIICECPFVEEKHWHHRIEGIIPTIYNSDKKDFDYQIALDNGDIFDLTDDLTPIPINEDWLKRFHAFKESPVTDWWTIPSSNQVPGSNIKYHPGTSYTQIGQTSIRTIKYVHEMQNLYYLITGIELPIKFGMS